VKFQSSSLWLNQVNSTLLFKLICGCWLITKLICYKLWLAQRFFPLLPVHDALQVTPAVVHTILFVVSLVCMGVLIFFPKRKIAVLLLLTEVLSCLLDQNRWQPWEYQFVCMLGTYVFITDEKKRVHAWKIILLSTYFFSGINKWSPYFIHNVWNHIFLKSFAGIYNAGPWLLRAGYLVPAIETIAAIALCFGRTRKIAVWFLSAMHMISLLVLGPAGIKINAVIWPWNLLMTCLLFGIFYKEPVQFFEKAIWKPIYTMLMLLAWCILPWLQLAGLWDKYLSCVLYNGRTEQLYICTNDLNASNRLSDCITFADKNMECSTAVSVYKWAMQEMNVPPYPELRTYKAIAASWNKTYPKAVNRFYIYQAGFSVKIKPLLPAN
jgi:hypothetical protein